MERKNFQKSTLPREESKNNTFEQIKKEFNKMENEKYKRPKKGEESKLTEYRKVTDKPVNKQEERQIVKNEILLLAKDLFNEKKINKPLYNKLYNITIGAARLPTLQATLSSLQEFKKEDNKSYKKGDFKAKLKEAKTENLGTFNVYVKYRLTINQDEEETTKDVNISDKVIGKINIQNAIKKNMDYLIDNPYTSNVEVIKIIINKMEVEPESYKITGVKKEDDKIKYYKAWQMGFKYHGYNVDLNDEIPFECVPNALVKMYGKQDTKRRDEYISAVKNGGIDYVKKCLDKYTNDDDELDIPNELDVDYDESKILPKGYTPMDILKFCNEHKLKCFGYNWKLA